MNDRCRHATRADFPALLETMVSGFGDDPLYVWLYPDAAERPLRLREGFELVLECGAAARAPLCERRAQCGRDLDRAGCRADGRERGDGLPPGDPQPDR